MKMRIVLALMLCVPLLGCANLHPAAKGALTPFTGIRDVVDAPFVTVTNLTMGWAKRSNPNPVPGAGVGWSVRGGFNFGIGYSVSHWFFKGVSWIFGGVDYVLCRSLYPNWPKGISPWRKQDQKWWDLYFPNTRALWRDPGDAPTETLAPQPTG